MPWVNFHSHCHYCDGKAAPEAYLVKAIEKGFPAYGYSSHAPLPFSTKWNMKQEQLPAYLEEIKLLKEKYKEKIQVYTGLEVDYLGRSWGFHNPFFKNIKLDYTVGSIHFVDHFPDGRPWTIDGASEEFFRGFELIFNNNVQKLVRRYYELVKEMIIMDHPSIIGHLDKIKMHNRLKPFLDDQEGWYMDILEETLDLIADNKCIVEVNTRGVYRYGQTDLYPGKWILGRIRQKKIPVMINSDAHLPDEINAKHAYAAAILKSIGFDSLKILKDNRWTECPFTESGIIWD
ncbi:MAG: histidinol-phosphatase [Bacteroidales bacterium]|nr:histidinol-phosphatase [Bacteroidales bacterium]MBN2762527.1 histidinol-phosphatase [Bacteroidales bacterium]